MLLGGSDELVVGVTGLFSTAAASSISSLTSMVSVAEASSIHAEVWVI